MLFRSGAAKQFINEMIKDAAAQNAEWMAEKGAIIFTDKRSGKQLTPEEIAARYENDGKPFLPLKSKNEEVGAAALESTPALGTAIFAAETVLTKGKNILQDPSDISHALKKSRKSSNETKIEESDHAASSSLSRPSTIKMDSFSPDCFKPSAALQNTFKDNPQKLEKEFYKQLKAQEAGINRLTVGEYLTNRQRYNDLIAAHGHTKAREILTDGGKAQKAARKDLENKIFDSVIESMERKGIFGKKAEEAAEKIVANQLSQLAALHDPDLRAGGEDKIARLGNKNVNSSLGSQWAKNSRAQAIDNAAIAAAETYGEDINMNIKLERCK